MASEDIQSYVAVIEIKVSCGKTVVRKVNPFPQYITLLKRSHISDKTQFTVSPIPKLFHGSIKCQDLFSSLHVGNAFGSENRDLWSTFTYR